MFWAAAIPLKWSFYHIFKTRTKKDDPLATYCKNVRGTVLPLPSSPQNYGCAKILHKLRGSLTPSKMALYFFNRFLTFSLGLELWCTLEPIVKCYEE